MDRLRLIRQLAIGAALALALVASLEVGADRSVFARGRLSAGHRDTACGRCHQGGSPRSRDHTCVSCHRAYRVGPARELGGTRCFVCHVEHRGGRPLPEARQRALCLGCHGTAEVSSDGSTSGALLEFHPLHRPAGAQPQADR